LNIRGGMEMNENMVAIITRSFQAGAGKGGKAFDPEYFSEKVVKPITKLLRFEEIIGTIIVVVNTEKGNRLAEIEDDNKDTPTIIALNQAFAREIENQRIIVEKCENWGNNPGSATALNYGTRIANRLGFKWIFNWSPEIEIDGCAVASALKFAKERNLSAVGVLRQRHWERPQWRVPQNTACLWKLDELLETGGFSEECNGTGRTIQVCEFGEVPIAGMEDFHTLLRMLEKNYDLRWGMIGRANPLKWNVDFPRGTERERNHLIKVARQYSVMKEWAKDIFPNLSFENVMDMVFANGHQD